MKKYLILIIIIMLAFAACIPLTVTPVAPTATETATLEDTVTAEPSETAQLPITPTLIDTFTVVSPTDTITQTRTLAPTFTATPTLTSPTSSPTKYANGLHYYVADRVTKNADFARLAAWGIDTAIVDFDVNGSSATWRAVFAAAQAAGVNIVVWPSDWNNPRPNCGWEAPYPLSAGGNIDKVKPLIDVAAGYGNFIGIISAHETFWTCDMTFDEQAGLKTKLKAYALSKGREIKVWNYINSLYYESMFPAAQIPRIMDVAIVWKHFAGNAEGTYTQAMQMVKADRARLANISGVELVYLIQTFNTQGYLTQFTLAELQTYSCAFVGSGNLDGFGYYTWNAGWWSDLSSWTDRQAAVGYVHNGCK